MVGDGGFMMTGQEIATAFHHGVAPIIMVFNNQMYGTIRMHQEKAYPWRVSGTELTNPDFFANILRRSAATAKSSPPPRNSAPNRIIQLRTHPYLS